MTPAVQLSRFTPSLMPADLLERLFVGREDLLARIMERIAEAGTSAGRNHTLLVGPRGAGKTHLIALAHHRARTLIDEGMALRTAWLPEDPWRIASYRHLLTTILDSVAPQTGSPTPARDVPSLEAAITRLGAEAPIVVFVENLDLVLTQIGTEGQHKFRHLLQDRRPLLLVATTTRLDRDLSDQARPFYGFFTTTRLEPFDTGQAARMLAGIAREQGDADVAAYLESDEAKARLRVIEHLAGGQPRLWALFGSSLTVSGIRELVDLLVTRFDDLTPYYQEQLGRLSPQQRLIVSELAAADRPMNVRSLAELVEVDERSAAKTLSELADRGWVRPTTSPVVRLLDRRRTYYELSEPLARIAFQIKGARDGQPVRLVVDFLKGWFDPVDLTSPDSTDAHVVEAISTSGDPVFVVSRRLSRLPVYRTPAVGFWGEIDDALSALAAGDPGAFLGLPGAARSAIEERLSAEPSGPAITELRLSIHREAMDDFGYVPHPAMREWVGRAEDLLAQSGETVAGLGNLANWHGRSWHFDAARLVLDASSGADGANMLFAQSELATAYESAGRLGDAIPLYERTLTDRVRLLGPDHPDTLGSRNRLAGAYESAGRIDEAFPLFEQTLTDRFRVLGPDHPDTLTSRNNLAGAHQSAGRIGDAIRLYEQTLTDRVRVLGPDHPDALASRNHLALAYKSAGLVADAVPLYEQTLTDRVRVLGPDHPDTLTSRNNLAGAYAAAGRIIEAIALYEQTLSDRVRVLGPDHPDTLGSLNNLAVAYWQGGQSDEAAPTFREAADQALRLLGPKHEVTRTLTANADEAARILRAGDAPGDE